MTCDDSVEKKKKDFEDCRDANTRGNVHGVNCANDDTNRELKIIVANFDKNKETKQKKTQDTYLVSSLDHSLLALHLDVLLLLGVGQGEWHTEQESTGADNPKGLAAE